MSAIIFASSPHRRVHLAENWMPVLCGQAGTKREIGVPEVNANAFLKLGKLVLGQ
jgi:hypothetical protein